MFHSIIENLMQSHEKQHFRLLGKNGLVNKCCWVNELSFRINYIQKCTGICIPTGSVKEYLGFKAIKKHLSIYQVILRVLNTCNTLGMVLNSNAH